MGLEVGVGLDVRPTHEDDEADGKARHEAEV